MSLTIINSSNIFQKDVIGNVRAAQEDSHDIAGNTPNGDVFVVCDGMGGHVGGKQASSIAVKSIIEYLQREKYRDPMLALNGALQFANMQILDYANKHRELKGMGTTACVLLLQDTEAYIAHVGDSRIYLYLAKENELHRITKDHSYVQTLVDAGEITDEEAEHHPNKNRIMKALGIKPDLSPSLGTVRPKNGDMFLICSDGLSGMAPDSEIKCVLALDIPVAQKGETLINKALDAGGVDNITLELIRITSSPYAKSFFKSYSSGSQQPDRLERKHPSVLKIILIAVTVIVACLALGSLVNRILDNRRHIQLNEQTQNVIKSLTDSIAAKQKALAAEQIDYATAKKRTEQCRQSWDQDKSNQPLKQAYEKLCSIQSIDSTRITQMKVEIQSLTDSLSILKKRIK